MKDYVFISALNQYAYCPRRCYYMFVECVFEDNEHTVEGTIGHARAHESGTMTRGDLIQARSVYLYSEKYGLCGKADIIEERAGQIYPVEYKKGHKGDWKNDELQLCAQGLCLEELTGREVNKGFIYYASTGRRKEVNITQDLKDQMIEITSKVRQLISSHERPAAHFTKRCKGCSLYNICLPREMEMVAKL